jgi:hypothetical protein
LPRQGFDRSDNSDEQRKAMLETRRSILRKLLLRLNKTKYERL